MADQDTIISDHQTIEDGVVVKVEGEIDLIRSPQLRKELIELLNTDLDRMVIDLSHVTFMDSSGVATLVEALQIQRRNNKKLILCGLQQKVKSIFEISRLDMVFIITEDTASAAQA